MIRVVLADEPAEFDQHVRQRGLDAIAEMTGKPPSKSRPGRKRKRIAEKPEDIPADKLPPLWRDALNDMLDAYHRRCAYLALHIEHATGSPTVDHVIPKSKAWDLVYEWSNYRLAAALINSKKNDIEVWRLQMVAESAAEKPSRLLSRLGHAEEPLRHRRRVYRCIPETRNHLFELEPGVEAIAELEQLVFQAPNGVQGAGVDVTDRGDFGQATLARIKDAAW